MCPGPVPEASSGSTSGTDAGNGSGSRSAADLPMQGVRTAMEPVGQPTRQEDSMAQVWLEPHDVDLTERRVRVVRRLLDRGLSPSMLSQIIPEWRALVEAARGGEATDP